jgi:hydrogenase maturation factor HypF (carbamoyltransferase family)
MIIETLCSILENGGVAVIKGTGGYNIICDAFDDRAVRGSGSSRAGKRNRLPLCSGMPGQ